MHLRLQCQPCSIDIPLDPPQLASIRPFRLASTGRYETVAVEIEDDERYVFTCDQGHRSVFVLTNPKFEILFEMGFLAYADGYTREAVATIAAAFEEFIRVFTHTALIKHGFGEDSGSKKLAKFLKSCDRAEVQLGAFTALFMIEEGDLPSYPDQESVRFRNSVIHRGKIPKAAQVAKWAEKVLAFVIPLYNKVHATEEFLLAKSYNMMVKLGSNPEPSTGGAQYPTAIGHLVSAPDTPLFEKAIAFVRTNKFLETNRPRVRRREVVH